MDEQKNIQNDPYRSPDEVTDSKSVAKHRGRGRWVVVAFVLLAIGVSGLLVFSTTTATFNMQRAPPRQFDAPQAIDASKSFVEEGPSPLQDDVSPDAENTQVP